MCCCMNAVWLALHRTWPQFHGGVFCAITLVLLILLALCPDARLRCSLPASECRLLPPPPSLNFPPTSAGSAPAIALGCRNRHPSSTAGSCVGMQQTECGSVVLLPSLSDSQSRLAALLHCSNRCLRTLVAMLKMRSSVRLLGMWVDRSLALQHICEKANATRSSPHQLQPSPSL
jgi:hypothetical protein